MSILKNNNGLKSSNRNRYNNFRNLICNSASLETQTKIDIEKRKKGKKKTKEEKTSMKIMKKSKNLLRRWIERKKKIIQKQIPLMKNMK